MPPSPPDTRRCPAREALRFPSSLADWAREGCAWHWVWRLAVEARVARDTGTTTLPEGWAPWALHLLPGRPSRPRVPAHCPFARVAPARSSQKKSICIFSDCPCYFTDRLYVFSLYRFSPKLVNALILHDISHPKKTCRQWKLSLAINLRECPSKYQAVSRTRTPSFGDPCYYGGPKYTAVQQRHYFAFVIPEVYQPLLRFTGTVQYN